MARKDERKGLFGLFILLYASEHKEEGKIRRITSIWICIVLCISGLAGIVIFNAPLGFVGRVSGTTLYVNTTGSGGAYSSIQDAVDAASPGNTVFVFNGIYYENIVVNKTINLIGENKDDTIIDGGKHQGYTVIIDANWVNVTGFTISNGSWSFGTSDIDGILRILGDYSTIANNNFKDNICGISFYKSVGNNLTGNSFIECGISIKGSLEQWNTHNIETSNTVNGKPIYYLKNQIGGTIPSGAGEVILANCTEVRIENQQLTHGTIGIDMGFSSNNHIVNNNLSSNSWGGISIDSSPGNNITGNNISSNGWFGLRLFQSDGNKIINNNVSSNYYQGILMMHSDSIFISSNTFSYNNDGILMDYSRCNNCTNNILVENGIYIGGSLIDYWNTHNIDTTNSINGKPVYYWKNKTLGSVPTDAGQVILANCNNIQIENLDLIHGTDGIILGFSSYNVIINNTVSLNKMRGISLQKSFHNDISANHIEGNNYGLVLYDSSNNNIIVGNNIATCESRNIGIGSSNANLIMINNITGTHGEGLSISSSSNNSIINNNISNNRYGLMISNSDRNNISGNNISNNSYGLNLQSSNNNNIYHNNFIDNIYQGNDEGDNKWNLSYPLGGNYWSDYLGIDIYKGFNQDILGFDGIGDIPYEIDTDTWDKYPLLEPIPDTLPPRIDLISPGNKSFILPGDTLDFSIYDGNLDSVNYNINSDENIVFDEPYDINTDEWVDEEYVVYIKAFDTEGNINSSWFIFTIDSAPPSIEFNSTINHSTIPAGSTIQLNITDPHLFGVVYSLNGGENFEILAPYILNTSGWSRGTYIVNIKANDTAGNEVVNWFEITINNTSDTIPPQIITTYPLSGSNDVEVNTIITITFSEPMDQIDVEDYISLIPYSDFNLEWDETSNILSISFETNNLAEATTYTLTIDSQITDIIGNPMGSDFVLIFTTKSPPTLDSDHDGIPDIDDPDDDNDGVPDLIDAYPLDPTKWASPSLDTDDDGIPDEVDDDDDGDGYPDENDAFPKNATEWLDTDSDGIGNNADPDDDNDEVPDEKDDYPLDSTKWKKQDKEEFTVYIFLVIAILIGSLILALFFIKRKKGKSEPVSDDVPIAESQPPPPPST